MKTIVKIAYILPFIIISILIQSCGGVGGSQSNYDNSIIAIMMQIDESSIYKFTFNKGHAYQYMHGKCTSAKKMRNKGSITINHKEKFVKILWDNGSGVFNIIKIKEFKEGNGLIYVCMKNSKSCQFFVDFDKKTFRWIYETKNYGEEEIIDFDITQFQELEQL